MTAIYWPDYTYPSPIWRRRWVGFIFGVGKLEWLGYNLVKIAWWATQSFGHNTSTWQTHRQPRRHSKCRANALCRVAKIVHLVDKCRLWHIGLMKETATAMLCNAANERTWFWTSTLDCVFPLLKLVFVSAYSRTRAALHSRSTVSITSGQSNLTKAESNALPLAVGDRDPLSNNIRWALESLDVSSFSRFCTPKSSKATWQTDRQEHR